MARSGRVRWWWCLAVRPGVDPYGDHEAEAAVVIDAVDPGPGGEVDQHKLVRWEGHVGREVASGISLRLGSRKGQILRGGSGGGVWQRRGQTWVGLTKHSAWCSTLRVTMLGALGSRGVKVGTPVAGSWAATTTLRIEVAGQKAPGHQIKHSTNPISCSRDNGCCREEIPGQIHLWKVERRKSEA